MTPSKSHSNKWSICCFLRLTMIISQLSFRMLRISDFLFLFRKAGFVAPPTCTMSRCAWERIGNSDGLWLLCNDTSGPKSLPLCIICIHYMNSTFYTARIGPISIAWLLFMPGGMPVATVACSYTTHHRQPKTSSKLQPLLVQLDRHRCLWYEHHWKEPCWKKYHTWVGEAGWAWQQPCSCSWGRKKVLKSAPRVARTRHSRGHSLLPTQDSSGSPWLSPWGYFSQPYRSAE